MSALINTLRRALNALLDRLPSQCQARQMESYIIPDFLRAPDPQLPLRPPAPPAEAGKESPTIVTRVVMPDLEIFIFSDGHQLKIPRSRKGR
jgi:hypothetical protein